MTFLCKLNLKTAKFILKKLQFSQKMAKREKYAKYAFFAIMEEI